MKRPTSSSSLVAGLWMCVAGLGWAVANAVSREMPPEMPVQELIWGRYAVQLALLLAIVWPRRGADLWTTKYPGRQVLRGLMMLAMPTFFLLGAMRLSVADVEAVTWLAPLIAVALATVCLGERATRKQWLVTAVAALGALLGLGASGRLLHWTLFVVPLGAAAAFAVFQVLTRAMRDEDTSTGLLYTALCVALPVAFAPGAIQIPTARGAAVLVGMGLSWGLVLVAIDEALKRAPIGRVAPLLYSQVIWTDLIGRFAFGDRLGARVLVGLALVAGAALLGPVADFVTDGW